MRATIWGSATAVGLALALSLSVDPAVAAPTVSHRSVTAEASAARTLHSDLRSATRTYFADVRADRRQLRNDPDIQSARSDYVHVAQTSTLVILIAQAWDHALFTYNTGVAAHLVIEDQLRQAWVTSTEADFVAYDTATDAAHAADALTYRTSVRSAYDTQVTGTREAHAAYDVCVAGSLATREAAIFAAHAQYNASSKTRVDQVRLRTRVATAKRVFTATPSVRRCKLEERVAERVARAVMVRAWADALDVYRAAVGHLPRYTANTVTLATMDPRLTLDREHLDPDGLARRV